MFHEEVFSDNDQYEQIIDTVSKRFATYGYKRIKTSAFQLYDLYTNVKSSINQNEMIKIIDYTGEVLVLRPDVTIPVTLEMAQSSSKLENEARYYYVQEVFRQPFERNEKIANTQAGIEYFCENSPEADAEVIALACHIMKDLGFKDIKIEIGHAAFFNELVQDLPLTQVQTSQLKTLIQAKNAVEIVPFLQNLHINEAICKEIGKIPFLYGNPNDVFSRVDANLITKQMQDTLEHIKQVFAILKMYGLEQYIAVDLGLINHMDYYSGIVFQGYIGHFGKPVLMGGRYDQLGNEFGANLPAIGFACEIESLAQASERGTIQPPSIDVKVIFDENYMEEAIWIANYLRDKEYRVLSFPKLKDKVDDRQSTCVIQLVREGNSLHRKGEIHSFTTREELLTYFQSRKEFQQ